MRSLSCPTSSITCFMRMLAMADRVGVFASLLAAVVCAGPLAQASSCSFETMLNRLPAARGASPASQSVTATLANNASVQLLCEQTGIADERTVRKRESAHEYAHSEGSVPRLLTRLIARSLAHATCTRLRRTLIRSISRAHGAHRESEHGLQATCARLRGR